MSTNLNELAQQAERDLNSHSAKHGHAHGDSTIESGVDTSVENKFAGAQVKYGSAATGREIPLDEGGSIKANGQTTKDVDFAHGGVGAPEERDQAFAERHGGDDSVRGNVRN
ncbi:hypothetical protein yc1106_06244 [Curvularia clavata]|uniref:Uncharacterized protein n=1 Tax=Curvularia clavata TaxID=95742 RepID=A0A9Q9DUG6_CURCL|nr:hypothetical protein yc1106_06244 [Curvularia clavata]